MICHAVSVKNIDSTFSSGHTSIVSSAGPALLSVLFLLLAASASEGHQNESDEPSSRSDSSYVVEVPQNTHPMLELDENGDYEEFAPSFHTDSWDSVMSAYDASVKKEAFRRISPEFGFRYTKAEGIHLEGGFSLGWQAIRINRLILTGGYDIGRERPAGRGELEFRIPGHDRLLLQLTGRSGVSPYGDHDPYATTLLAAVAGFDARNYLEERAVGAGIICSASPDNRITLEWFRMRHAPVGVVEDWHLFGTGHWMSINDVADAQTVNGIGLRLSRRPAYLSEASIRGLILDVEALTHGGSILGGDREYGRLAADLWYTRQVRKEDSLHLRSAMTLATGRAPRQALGDLGGGAGLKGFPPRGYDTPDTLVGTSRVFSRIEYRHADRLLRRTRLPLTGSLGLKLVPFIEGGAVWGDDPILEFSDVRGPARSEFLWDLGIGLRKDFDLSGILSHLQVDFAWPMGHRRGPVRIGITLSDVGLH